MYSNDETAILERKEDVHEHLQQKKSNYRWVIVSLLLFSTTINYMDRNVIGYLKDYFCSPLGFGWSAKDFSFLTSIFTAFYAGFTLFAGFIMDRVGTKKGLAFSLTMWSFAGISSSFMGTGLWLHNAARAIFGAGEAGNFPASTPKQMLAKGKVNQQEYDYINCGVGEN